MVLKYRHEIRDPVHQFIVVTNDERRIIDSRPVQRLREVHQLAMSHLVYPGATHRRFEHSLGVMELASQAFDVVTNRMNVDDRIRSAVPELNEDPKVAYGREVVRLAGLCHDLGHLPFSHAVEHELLPEGRSHENLTVDLLTQGELPNLLSAMEPPVKPETVAKVAVGPKHWKHETYTVWEALPSEIITGDAFGADRMNYLLRDSLHAGVADGRYDLHRLVQSLRILVPPEGETDEERPASPTIGVERGGIHSAEAFLLARYFMFTRVYFHPVRGIFDQHLYDFPRAWLPDGRYPDSLEDHLNMTDSLILVEMRRAAADLDSPAAQAGRRIIERDHLRLLYEPGPGDRDRHLQPALAVATWARNRYGQEAIRVVQNKKGGGTLDFPVRVRDGRVTSPLTESETLRNLPSVTFEGVFVDRRSHEAAEHALLEELETILDESLEEET